ncbi:MAG: hypothetical protein U9N12_02370 [Euryarchaeota archaeon]|nr:hypothetical protein [Euryarchaeota archaeon]
MTLVVILPYDGMIVLVLVLNTYGKPTSAFLMHICNISVVDGLNAIRGF